MQSFKIISLNDQVRILPVFAPGLTRDMGVRDGVDECVCQSHGVREEVTPELEESYLIVVNFDKRAGPW